AHEETSGKNASAYDAVRLMDRTSREWLRHHAIGATMPNLNEGIIRRFSFLAPSLREQEIVAEVLDSLDEKIDVNRRMNTTFEAMAHAIFKDWFIDFGPTRAKATDSPPYLARDVWEAFPKETGDGGIPVGWRRGQLGDIALQTGQSVKPEFVSAETPYIGLEHMPRRSIALDAWGRAAKVTSGKTAFSGGDLLFGKLRPYFHKVGIAPVNGICSTDIVVLNSRSPDDRPFVISCISQDEFVAYTDRTAYGTKMPRTSWSRMEKFGICIPSTHVLTAFNRTVSPLIDRIVANVLETRTLTETRDLLLPRLMSGEIRIRDVEQTAVAAA
ncbi:MAG: restriction endonuclease subunit S, partial [Rhodospirillales bacterium]|nr:restriction endonuclease subunit S [Rhodospirillales bacterium]